MWLHSKQSLPDGPVRVNSEKTFAKDNKIGNVLNIVRRKIMKLNPVHIEECTEKWMKGERKTSRKVVGKHHPIGPQWMGNFLILVRLAEATRCLRNLALLL